MNPISNAKIAKISHCTAFKFFKKIPCFQYLELMLIHRRKGLLLSETVSQSLWLCSLLGLKTAVDKLLATATSQSQDWFDTCRSYFTSLKLHSISSTKNEFAILRSRLFVFSGNPRQLNRFVNLSSFWIMGLEFRILARPFKPWSKRGNIT